MIGHTHITQALQEWASADRVVLFVGPRSVGKWTAAESLIWRWGIPEADVIKVPTLTIEAAKSVQHLLRRGAIGSRRAVLVRLDGSSSAAKDALLVAIEETPPEVVVFLISSEPVPATLSSRASVFQFSLLSTTEVAQVLRRRHFTDIEAERLSRASGGQVRTALKLAKHPDHKVEVLAAVRAIVEHDVIALDLLAGKWTDDHTDLLADLCHETITRRWKLFIEDEVAALSKKKALRLLGQLRTGIRPRLLVRSSLMEVLQEA